MSKPNVLILVVDTQVDFVMSNGRLPVPGAEAIIAPGIRFLAGLDPTEVAGVLFTFDTHTEESFLGSPENLGDEAAGVPGFPIHCEKGTPGWTNVFNPEIIPAGIPYFTLEKGVFDMWEEPSDKVLVTEYTRLRSGDRSLENQIPSAREDFLTVKPRYANDFDPTAIDTVRVIGVASDFCVRWAIAGLLERGYRVEVVADLTAGIQKDIERTVVDEFAGKVLVI